MSGNRLPPELVAAVAKAFGVAPATARAALDEDERVKYDLRRRNRLLRGRAAQMRASFEPVEGIG